MIGTGNSGTVHLVQGGTQIRKTVSRWRQDQEVIERQVVHLRNEIAIYKHLPQNHRRFVRFCDSFDDGKENVTIDLEYMPHGTLHEYLRGYTLRQFMDTRLGPKETQADKERRMRRRHDSIPLRQRARWALEAADAVVALHANDVIHSDLKPENMGVDANLSVRIFDFAGSSLKGSQALSLESTRYYMPRKWWDDYGVVTDCFALGSSIYHIVTGVRPYDKVPDREVDACYERGEFPDLSGVTEPEDASDTSGISQATGMLLFANTIRMCWHGGFASAQEVLESLEDEVVRTFDDGDISSISEMSGINLDIRRRDKSHATQQLQC